MVRKFQAFFAFHRWIARVMALPASASRAESVSEPDDFATSVLAAEYVKALCWNMSYFRFFAPFFGARLAFFGFGIGHVFLFSRTSRYFS